MRYPGWVALAFLAFALALPRMDGQREPREPQEPTELRLPNGKSQQEEMLKAEHRQSLKDAAQLIELSEQLKAELEKNDRHVVSVSSLKKTEEIEKLARRIRGRLRRY